MQRIAIIASSRDSAGVNIRSSLINLFGFRRINKTFEGNEVHEFSEFENSKIRLYLINSELVYSEGIDKIIDADILIFASKHRSKENTPSFAAHAIGNWSEAGLGGKEKHICPSSAVLLKNIFLELNATAKNSGSEITLEATHHGPYVEKPAVFVEIGSTEKEWNEKANGEIIAKTIINAINNKNRDYKIAIGIGGPHYCSNFNKTISKTDIAFSHICPKYSLQNLDENLVRQAIEKTIEKVDFILLDWKGLGKEKQKIVEMLKNLNLEFERSDKIKD